MKKQLLVIASILFSLGANAQGAWYPQATGFTDVSSGVFNVSVVDANVVWISSYDGSGGMANRRDYSRTTDGGATWVAGTVPAPAGYNWSMINAVDANNAWALFYDGIPQIGGGLWHTSDGGLSWAQQGVGTIFNASSFPDVVYFWDASQGVTMGDPNSTEFEIYTTTDGGTTWVPVPGANIPDPLTGEYGIVDHYTVFGNTIWFDTNKGRVYKSTDFGLNWTVSVTGITVPTGGAFDLVFYSATNGVARLYNNTTGVNIMYTSSDGGSTWNSATPTGNFWGSDFAWVPGTASRLVSTGAAPGFVGSSYSDDGGLTWIDIEMLAQRTALGIVDTSTMWAGGFTTSPTSDGIYKYQIIPVITCADPTITAGTSAASDAFICFGDTLTVTSTGVVAPTVGDFSGVSWVISSADITGTTDPLNEPSLVATYTFTFPAPSNSLRQLINDGTLIGGPVPYGTYYWTPVVFGNAIAINNPPVFLTDLALDATCTIGGVSVLCNVLPPGDPLCLIGITEQVNSSVFSIKNIYPVPVKDNVNFTLNAKEAGTVTVSVKDFVGREVLSTQFATHSGENKLVLDMVNQSAGVYFLTVTGNESTVVSKFVKN